MIKDIFNKYEIIIKEDYLHIKHYSKIIDIDSSKIEIVLDKYKVYINGSSLIVSALNEYEIIIRGMIKSIEFNNE